MALEYPFELPATLFHSIGMDIHTQIDAETLQHFSKALMVIVGADKRLSMWERGWLAAFLAAYHAPDTLMHDLEEFDYHEDTLDTHLEPLLAGQYARWVRRSLLQGAIRMARSDTLSIQEMSMIYKLGERLGMDADTVDEIRSLLEMFDSVTGTNTILLSIAQKEDAETGGQTDALPIVGDGNSEASWDDTPVSGDKEIAAPQSATFHQSIRTFARALLYVAGADGEISAEESAFFRIYMHTWGASPQQVEELLQMDWRSITPQDIVQDAYSLNWGLKALTSVALRTAGADGLSAAEENAILELYRQTGRSTMHYYAAKGLEEVRAMALRRLNDIFAEYL